MSKAVIDAYESNIKTNYLVLTVILGVALNNFFNSKKELEMIRHPRTYTASVLMLLMIQVSAYAQTNNPAAIGADLARDINTTIMQEMSANEKAALSEIKPFGNPIEIKYNENAKNPPVILTMVESKHTGGAVAAQVGVSILMSVLSGGISMGASSFKKNQLAGSPITNITDKQKLFNPTLNEFRQQFAGVIDEQVKTQFADKKFKGYFEVTPDVWKLVYDKTNNENADESTYKLHYGVTVARGGGGFFSMQKAETCQVQSEAKSLKTWKENDYAALAQARTPLIQDCLKQLSGKQEKMIGWLVD